MCGFWLAGFEPSNFKIRDSYLCFHSLVTADAFASANKSRRTFDFAAGCCFDILHWANKRARFRSKVSSLVSSWICVRVRGFVSRTLVVRVFVAAALWLRFAVPTMTLMTLYLAVKGRGMPCCDAT